jgi:hypothetical protein
MTKAQIEKEVCKSCSEAMLQMYWKLDNNFRGIALQKQDIINIIKAHVSAPGYNLDYIIECVLNKRIEQKDRRYRKMFAYEAEEIGTVNGIINLLENQGISSRL